MKEELSFPKTRYADGRRGVGLKFSWLMRECVTLNHIIISSNRDSGRSASDIREYRDLKPHVCLGAMLGHTVGPRTLPQILASMCMCNFNTVPAARAG